MKKLNLSLIFLFFALFFTVHDFAQVSNPISLQRRLPDGKKPPAHNLKFNPTLKTFANPSLAPGVTDGVDVRVLPSANVQSEVTIAINKTNPQNLLAAANTLVGPFSYNQGFYSSSNGGLTWSGADVLQNIAGDKIAGDPSVAFAANGTAYMTSIGLGTFGTSGYWFQRSTDGGLNWSAGVKGNNGFNFDKEMITADNTATSPFVNNFYCAWTDFNSGGGAVAFNRSTDGGVTFSTKLQIRSGTVGFGQGTNVQTGPNGEVYVCWADHTTVISPYEADGMGFARSTNGGVSFTPATVIFPYAGIRVDATSNRFNFTRVNDFPAMAVDKSNGPRRGRIYIAYPEKNANGNSQIKVRISDNQGNTWSQAVIVNIPNARESFFPWITVDDVNGIPWVVYYAFDQASGFATNTYVAGSPNGGRTWVNLRVSDVSHITAPIDNTNFAPGYAGDYIGIAANNLKAYPVWMDNRNGTWQVYFSPVTVTTAFAAVSDEFAIAENKVKLDVSPNPFTSIIRLNLSNTSIASARLYNQYGTLIKQWNNPGSTVLNVADVPKGIYTVRVIGKDNKAYEQKIIKP